MTYFLFYTRIVLLVENMPTGFNGEINQISTSQNLSRFSKCLQKSVEKQLGQKITLTQASLLLANTFGVDSIHHLQKKLESSNTKEHLINNSSSEEADIISFIEKIL